MAQSDQRWSGRDSDQRHPNAGKLLDAAVDLLASTPIEHITLAEVLERSGVSNGTLYHHFEDLQDLVEKAALQRFQQGLDETLAALATLVSATDSLSFRRRLEAMLVHLSAQDRRPLRLARLDTLGSLRNHPRLVERLARVLHRHYEQEAAYVAEFQRRGWLRGDLDPLVVTKFISAIHLGRVVDDVDAQPVDPAEWTRVALIACRAILFSD